MLMLVLCMFILNYMPLTLDDEFIARSRALGEVLVPSIEDLIILKLMGGEDKDIEDVKRLLGSPTWTLTTWSGVPGLLVLIRTY